MTEDRYYCEERGCECFVDKDHRCEQWSNTVRIPGGAIDEIRREAQVKAIDDGWAWIKRNVENHLLIGDSFADAILGKEEP